MSISVLILTYNEENIIEECLKSVLWSDDIVILDSYSTDRTVEIASKYNVRIEYRHFDNEKSHREASLRLGFKNDWVYNPDADEITTSQLRCDMFAAVSQSDSTVVAYQVRFKVVYQDKWLKYSSQYPVWVYRLFKPEKITFNRMINLEYLVGGETDRLDGHFIHYTFNKGVSHWIDKHNEYSTVEASETIKSLVSGGVNYYSLFSADDTVRRRSLKELSFRLPFRYVFKFFYVYIFKRGFMDGLPGLRYCVLQMIYEYFIVIKVDEMNFKNRNNL